MELLISVGGAGKLKLPSKLLTLTSSIFEVPLVLALKFNKFIDTYSLPDLFGSVEDTPFENMLR